MESKHATIRDLRRRNRAVLLSALYFSAPLSRLELSRLTGLSAATVSNVTAQLLEDRLIAEAGQAESEGGRPRVLLRVDPGYGHVIGVDVGETGVIVELFDLGLTRLATATSASLTVRPDPEAVAAQAADGMREVLAASGIEPGSLLGVGIGLPGVVERAASALVHAPTIGWNGAPLEALLRERGVDAPLFLDNGAKTMGQAEMWFGSGRGARHAVIALIGSGVGAAVIADGTTYRGVSSSAGEWGHTTLIHGGRPCRCGSRGCLEAYIGAEGVLDRYRQAGGVLSGRGGDEQGDLKELIETASGQSGSSGQAGSSGRNGGSGSDGSATLARELLEETASYLGAGIANLINLFNPQRVVLGGWAGLQLGGRMLPQIRRAAREHALAHPFSQTSIELCRLGPDAVAFGAATLPVAELLARGADPRNGSPGGSDAFGRLGRIEAVAPD